MPTCKDCDCETDVELSSYDGEDAYVCDGCDQYYEWCGICQTNLCTECGNPCRHLFWSDDNGEWMGVGAGEDYHVHRDSFFAVLDKIGRENALKLQWALENHQYFFQYWGAMLSAPSLDATLGLPDASFVNAGNAFVDDLSDGQEEAMAIGVGWLMSLWAGAFPWKEKNDCGLNKTPGADLVTAEWVNHWLKSRGFNA